MKRRSVLFLMIAVLLLFAVGCAAGPAKTEEPNSSSSSMSVPSESESSAPPAETEERPEEPEGSASEESDASSSGQSAVPAGPATTQELFAEGYPEAQELLENMTLEEKVAQVFLFRCPSEDALAAVQTYQPGGFMLFAKDFDGKTAEQIRTELESYQQASKIPMFLAVDEEGGTVVRVSRNANLAPKPFQSPQQVFQSGGMQAIVDDTVQTQLLQSLGLNVNLAPVADVSTNPADFMYDRTFGQGAAATADYVDPWSRRWRKTVWAASSSTSPAMGTMWIPTPVSPWTSGRWSPSRPPTSSPSRRVWRAAAERPLCWSPTIS